MRTETNAAAGRPEDRLTLSGISKSFGGLLAASNVSFEIQPGSIHGLIGPNGAGKSTIINIVSGSLRPDAGGISLGTSDVTGIETSILARRGVVRTFQQATPLAGLTVLENVLVGLHHHYRSSIVSVALRTAGMRAEAAELLERGLVLLRRFGLQSEAEAPAETLTFGKLRMLELARAVAMRPKFLLLDEPAAGLNGVETEILAAIIGELRSDGVGVLLVDHDVPFVFKLCDRMTVMNFGTVIASGVPDQVYRDAAVRQAYLGPIDPNSGAVS
jgi:branched-chain amino acid transport system ATP-binding protein